VVTHEMLYSAVTCAAPVRAFASNKTFAVRALDVGLPAAACMAGGRAASMRPCESELNC
jgi:hypothetical protein